MTKTLASDGLWQNLPFPPPACHFSGEIRHIQHPIQNLYPDLLFGVQFHEALLFDRLHPKLPGTKDVEIVTACILAFDPNHEEPRSFMTGAVLIPTRIAYLGRMTPGADMQTGRPGKRFRRGFVASSSTRRLMLITAGRASGCPICPTSTQISSRHVLRRKQASPPTGAVRGQSYAFLKVWHHFYTSNSKSMSVSCHLIWNPEDDKIKITGAEVDIRTIRSGHVRRNISMLTSHMPVQRLRM